MFTDKTDHWLNVIFREKVLLPGTEGVIVPSGNTGQRPSPADEGTIRYNTGTDQLEVYRDGNWEDILTSGSFSVSNVGTGAGVFFQQVANDFQFRSLVAGANTTITEVGNEILITATGGGGSGGEDNSGVNIGTGVGVFDSKVGVNLRFKSILSNNAALTVTDGGTDVVLDLIGAPYLSISGGTLTGDLTLSSARIINSAGLETSPSYTFQTDQNTGMYLGGADLLTFVTNGTDRFSIDPVGALRVPGSANYETLVTDDDVIPNKKYVDDLFAGSSSSFRQTFSQANLIAGVVQIAHNLGQDFVQVTVYDNNKIITIPDNVTSVSNNIIDIDLNSFEPLPGNWNVVVLA